jgi:hypothetical protein
MTDWRTEIRTCDCGSTFKPKRESQRHCRSACRVKDAMARYRRSDNRSGDTLTLVPRSDNTPASDSLTASEWDNWPVCPVCKLWEMLPRKGLPRHMFCIAGAEGWGNSDRTCEGSMSGPAGGPS